MEGDPKNSLISTPLPSFLVFKTEKSSKIKYVQKNILNLQSHIVYVPIWLSVYVYAVFPLSTAIVELGTYLFRLRTSIIAHL